VGNQQPVAETGPNKVSPVPGLIYLDGTGSYDPDPIDKLSYSWTQLEGPQVVLENANTATPFFDCNEEGLYVFELVVNDSFVDSEPSVIQVQTVIATINQHNINVSFPSENFFYYPDVSGPTVVYCVGSYENYTWNIQSKNFETDFVEDAFMGGGIDTQPKIDGDIIVWAGGPVSPGYIGPECISVFVRNIATGTQHILREHSNTESYSHPAVSANKVVWLEHLNINKFNMSDWQNTPYNICGADITELDKPVYFTIATNVGRRDPYPYNTYNEDFDDVIDISENIVVWEAGGDIYGADISNIDDIRIFVICSDPARQSDPAISGNLVVWTDERNDGGDIYGADISEIDNIQELTIVKVSGTQQQPAIDGCLIVYVNGNIYGQIRVCCLTKKSGVMDIELSGFPFGMCPVIDGQSIVWQNNIYGQAEGISLEFSYSSASGPIENLTIGRKYDYIQHAIVSASAGNRIVVDEGIYHEDINFKGKNLTVSSTAPNDPAVVAATIIDGSSRAVTFLSSADTKCILSGFTITGSSKGIYCSGGTSPTITNHNTITNCNITGNTGAGVKLYSGGNPVITNCSISANAGAGIEMPDGLSTPIIPISPTALLPQIPSTAFPEASRQSLTAISSGISKAV
jgi:beta propeller repeat protein/parallel beta-helix repeat protein